MSGLSNDVQVMFISENKYNIQSRRHSESQWNGVWGGDVAICWDGFVLRNDEIATGFGKRTRLLKPIPTVCRLAMTEARECGLSNSELNLFFQ